MNWLWRRCTLCVNRLAQCRLEDFWQALFQATIEVGLVVVSAFVPLWAGIGTFLLSTRPGSAREYANSIMTSGEMLLITCAIIGPLTYIVTKKYGRLARPLTFRFPFSTGFSVLIGFFWFIAGGVFTVKKVTEFYHVKFFADESMWYLSLVVTVLGIVLLYLATILRNCMDRADPGRLMHDQQERFVQDFNHA